MEKVECPKCKFKIYIETEEKLYEKYLFCMCGNSFINLYFVGNIKLNEYLERMNSLHKEK